jgi:hypothetical protein
MSGPECYKAALDCLDSARRASDKGRDDDATFWQREGQVLATLALAAATAMNDAEGGMGVKDYEAWRRVASATPPAGKEATA